MKLFPWRVFWQFIISQWLAFTFVGIAMIATLLAKLDFQAQTPWFWIRWGLVYFSVTFVVAAFNAYRFAQPIRRTLYLALRMANKKQVENYAPPTEDLFHEEVGEYSELEQALNRIAKKLRKKKEQLYREREESQAIMGSVQEGLLSISPDEKILYFNSQFATLFMHRSLLQRNDLSLTDIFR